jgi:hypothetical protein
MGYRSGRPGSGALHIGHRRPPRQRARFLLRDRIDRLLSGRVRPLRARVATDTSRCRDVPAARHPDPAPVRLGEPAATIGGHRETRPAVDVLRGARPLRVVDARGLRCAGCHRQRGHLQGNRDLARGVTARPHDTASDVCVLLSEADASVHHGHPCHARRLRRLPGELAEARPSTRVRAAEGADDAHFGGQEDLRNGGEAALEVDRQLRAQG